jgi:hypothetical protein
MKKYIVIKTIKLSTQNAPIEPSFINIVKSFFMLTDTKNKYAKIDKYEAEN